MNTLPALLEHATLSDHMNTSDSIPDSQPVSGEEPSPTDTQMDDNLQRGKQRHSEVHELFQPRPSTPRRSTEPYSPSLLNPLVPRQRNRSPYSRSHYRSHSGSSPVTAPPMTRAQSLPAVIHGTPSPLTLVPTPSSPTMRPASPLRSPARARSPFRVGEELYAYSGAPTVCDISEDSELELTPKALQNERNMPSSPLFNTNPSYTFPRRRRPASPLHQVASANSAIFSTPTSSNNSSPLLSATKYNEPFPINFPASLSSSIPSTPTSTRSRSPSISSLETIPDSPDAEAEAIEEDRLSRLRATEEPRRGSLDEPTRRISFTNRDKRKRWSVCGGERRQDLDLETIYED